MGLADWVAVNLCRETTDTTGVTSAGNPYVLDGAVAQRLPFSAQMADTNETAFCVLGAGSPPDYEIFYGTYHSGANTIEPTDVRDSSNGGSSVNWGAGTKDIFCVVHSAMVRDLTNPYVANGMVAKTAKETFTTRTIASADSNLTVTDGDGVSGNPTLDASKLLRLDAAASDAQRTMAGKLLITPAEFLELGTFPATINGTGGSGDNAFRLIRNGASDYTGGLYIGGTLRRFLTTVDIDETLLNGAFEYSSAGVVRLVPLINTYFSVTVNSASAFVYQNTGTLTFDHSTDFEGTETSSSAVYYYVSVSGSSLVPHASHTAPDLRGDTKPGYHPSNSGWRCVGAAWNDDSSDLVPFIVEGKTARFLGNVASDHIYQENDSSPGPLDLPSGLTGATWRDMDLNVPVGSTSAQIHFIFQGEERTAFIAASDATTSPPITTNDPGSGNLWNWISDSEMAETLYTVGIRDVGSTSATLMLHAEIPIADPTDPQFKVAMARNNSAGQLTNEFKGRLLAFTFPYFPSV